MELILSSTAIQQRMHYCCQNFHVVNIPSAADPDNQFTAVFDSLMGYRRNFALVTQVLTEMFLCPIPG
jgi:hypothetical protein